MNDAEMCNGNCARLMRGNRMGPIRNIQGVLGAFLLIRLILAPTFVTAASYAPTHFLGKCLDQAWVDATAQTFNLSPTERDSLGRLKNPYLHAALKETRFTVNDPRVKDVPMSKLYQSDCRVGADQIYGVGNKVDPATGEVLDPGTVDGSVIVESKFWATSFLLSSVFSILAREVLGYPVSVYDSADMTYTSERMASVRSGACSPVHVNCDDDATRYAVYANESYTAAVMGFVGRWGLYVNKELITNGADPTKFSPTFGAGYWFDYTSNDNLIGSIPVSELKNDSKYYPTSTPWCPDGYMGCQDGCARTEACTQRELAGKECLVVVLKYTYYAPGYAQAVLDNLGIPAYMCFLGAQSNSYIIESHEMGRNVMFQYYEPDQFHAIHEGKFERIFLPRHRPEDATMSTLSYGENGYGVKTTNPVNVDFPPIPRLVFASNVLQELQPLANFVSRFSFSDFHINKLVKTYVNYTSEDSGNQLFQEDPKFSAACSWVRENYDVWSLWLPRLPECDAFTHMNYSISGCDSGSREIRFAWLIPDPDNATNPYACDGGLAAPPVLYTSRSCDWLNANFYVWIGWIFSTPRCDDSFYTFDTSLCDSSGTRTATYRWLLPNPNNASISQECIGDYLPEPVQLQCAFVPYETTAFSVVAVTASILVTLLLLLIGLVYRFRYEPIIKRSQWEFLIVMALGGILMCLATIVYAGDPTDTLCAARPAVVSTAFTLIFGTLLMKSLRVYRVFMSKAMKRVVLSSAKMFRILGLFLLIDAFILLAWFAVDYPTPTYQRVAYSELEGGTVSHHKCSSSSFIFSALLIFWKTIVLLVGLYVSFLIRNVSTDFQESLWIFASSMVVMFASVVVLPMAYLVKLPPLTFYCFLSFALLFSTALVMGMMFIPKFVRLHDSSESGTTTSGTTSDHGNETSDSSVTAAPKPNRFRIRSLSKPTVTPIMPFVPQSKRSETSQGKHEDAAVENVTNKKRTSIRLSAAASIPPTVVASSSDSSSEES